MKIAQDQECLSYRHGDFNFSATSTTNLLFEQKIQNYEIKRFCGKYYRNYVGHLKNHVIFLVVYMYKTNFLSSFRFGNTGV